MTALADTMRDRRFLVTGTTGDVGSKITGRLAERGVDVTAMLRRSNATIEDPYNGAVGGRSHENSNCSGIQTRSSSASVCPKPWAVRDRLDASYEPNR